MTTPDPLAQAALVAYCGWDPTAQVTNASVVLSGNGSPSIFLPSLAVTAVSAVTITAADGSTYAAQIGAGLDVSWRENGELRWLPTAGQPWTYWPEGLDNIAVTYSGGYSPIPADLTAALNSLSGRMPTIQGGLTSAKIGTASVSYAAPLAAGGFLLVEQMVFDRYRLPRVA